MIRRSVRRTLLTLALPIILAAIAVGCNKGSDDTKPVAPPANSAVQQGGNAPAKPPKGHD